MGTRIKLLSGAAGTALLVGAALALNGATAASAANAPDTQPGLEETFDYPGADKIFAERGFHLYKGDGRITLVDCPQNPDGVLRIESDSLASDACFKVRGGHGYLKLEIPEAKLIRGDKTNYLQAKVDGVVDPITVKPVGFTPILGDLIELRVIAPPAK